MEEESDEEVRDEPTVAEIVQAGIGRGRIKTEDVPIDIRELDEAEKQLIKKFVQGGCHCLLGANESPCCSTITIDH